MDEPFFTEAERAEITISSQAYFAAMTDAELFAARERLARDSIKRDEGGRFAKGAPTPNPAGRGAGRDPGRDRRRFGMSQTIKDLFEQLEQPVEVRKGKVTRKVPAIVAINERLIHMAVGGDWNAMKKVIDLREKYSDLRGKTLAGLMEEATNCRQVFKDYNEEMPPHVKQLVEYVERRVIEGQFDAD